MSRQLIFNQPKHCPVFYPVTLYTRSSSTKNELKILIILSFVKISSKQLITSGNCCMMIKWNHTWLLLQETKITRKPYKAIYFKTVPKESAKTQTTALFSRSSSTIEESVIVLGQPLPNAASVSWDEENIFKEISLLGNMFCDFRLPKNLKFFQDDTKFDTQLTKLLKSFRVE